MHLPAPVRLHSLKEMASTAQVNILIPFFLSCRSTTNTAYYFSVPDPCLDEPCDPNALCEREGILSGNFTCTCLSPFTVGDGFNCSSKWLVTSFLYPLSLV